MRHASKLVILVPIAFCTFGLVSATEDQNLRLGFAVCQTVKTVGPYPTPQEVVPWTVIRFVDSRKTREVFAFSDKDGMATVPLRPGRYCFEAYDENGKEHALDPDQPNCFSIKQSELLQVGVVVK